MIASRRAYTLIEILVASAVFLVAVVYSVGTIFFSKRAADRTDRVDEYREMRIVFNRIGRDLQESSRVRLPTYDQHSYRLRISDSRDREIVYSLRDDSGKELTSEPPADAGTVYRVTRSVGGGASAADEVIRQTGNIAWMRFTRLGERLIGMTIRMRARVEDQPGATYTATMSVPRVML